MKVEKLYNKENELEGYIFYCPGCEFHHMVFHNRWTFNGDLNKPTFTPSLLNRANYPDGLRVCHLFVTDGKIQYLNDCTHKFAGQTIEMEDIE